MQKQKHYASDLFGNNSSKERQSTFMFSECIQTGKKKQEAQRRMIKTKRKVVMLFDQTCQSDPIWNLFSSSSAHVDCRNNGRTMWLLCVKPLRPGNRLLHLHNTNQQLWGEKMKVQFLFLLYAVYNGRTEGWRCEPAAEA